MENVIARLYRDFPGGNPDVLDPKAVEALLYVKDFLQDYFKPGAMITVEQDTVVDSAEASWDPDADVDESDHDCPAGLFIKFSGVNNMASPVKVAAALAFYRGALTKDTRKMSCLKSKFPFIRTENDKNVLRKFESEGLEAVLHRKSALKALANDLFDWMKEKEAAGMSLHDSDLQRAAILINQEKGYAAGFKASDSWILKFKKNHNFGSRKITKTVSRVNFEKRDELEKTIAGFVEEVQAFIEQNGVHLDGIFNADQSGFIKEMQSKRTLATKGQKNIVRVAENIAATTHSCTVMPKIYMDGSVDPELYVVLQEKDGRLPKSFRPGKFGNLVVRSHTSHIMTKNLMVDWFRTCVAPHLKPNEWNLVLVDSWSSFKDHAALLAEVPPGFMVKIMNIPPGTTGMGQPLDVGYFRFMKMFEKKIVDYVKLFLPVQYPVHVRDNLLRIHSVTHRHMSNPRFTNFVLHAWKKSGYFDDPIAPYLTPVQVCYPPFDGSSCAEARCSEHSFATCSYCGRRLCFGHFVIQDHTC